MSIFDLSLRHKIPLWGSLLVVTTTFVISAALMVHAYDDLKQDLFISSENLGHTLAKTLFSPLLHDDLWRAFEIINAPLHGSTVVNPHEAESIFVLSPDLAVLVATDPKRMPTLATLESLGSEHQRLAHALQERPLEKTRAIEFPGARQLYVATPIAEAGRQVGTLVIAHGKDAFWRRFLDLAASGTLIGVLVIAVILPINWYWGRRTAQPLVALAKGMGALVHGQVSTLDAGLYTYRDELGQLFAAYRDAATALHEKVLLEQEVMKSERLAAVGRLAAGIAHEVNNPLGGMLMAVDNLKRRGSLEPHVAKTMALLERGLQQITDTVGALLVQARVSGRHLTRHDFEDVRTLVEPQSGKRGMALDWVVRMPESVPVPAGFVRQITINLLLNAIQAASEGGQIRLEVDASPQALTLQVANSGEPPPVAIREHLFEPFVSGREGGHGLGLWITYQTVTQLGGTIAADWPPGEVKFVVHLPLEEQNA